MQNTTGTQLIEAWGSLLALFRESIVFSPSAQFLLIAILHELMTKCCPLPDRKDQKDLQDVTGKVTMQNKLKEVVCNVFIYIVVDRIYFNSLWFLLRTNYLVKKKFSC